MKSFLNSALLEKAFIFIFLFVFLVFAVFFTVLNLKETENDFNNQRLNFTKNLAEEIRYLIEKRIDVSYKLSNALAQNAVAYAVVHFSDGTLLARSEGYAFPVGIFEIAEANALKTQYLTLTPFKDPSGRFSIVEASIPIYTNEGIRYVLRLGFLKTTEEDKLSYLRLRNILIFSLIFIFFISVRNIHYFSSFNLRYVLLITMTMIMVVLFFASSYFIREWSISSWRDSFISNECVNLSKMLIPGAINLIEKGSSSEITSLAKQLKDNKDFEMLSVIKDDVYVYHTDASKIGSKVSGDYYRKSLNTDKSSVFKNGISEDYTAMIPVMNDKNRIGTICTLWKNYSAFESFSNLRNKLTLIFVFAYLLLYWFISHFSNEFSKLNTESDKKEDVSLPEKISGDINKSPSKNLLSVSVFVYFSGIAEAVEKLDKDSLNQSVKDCFETAESLLNDKTSSVIRLEPDGISVLFKDENEQNSVFEALDYSKKLKEVLNQLNNLIISPKITLHICKLVYIDNNNFSNTYLGDSKIDYKTIAKVQSRNDIILSEESYNYLKELVKFETMELISLEQGKINVYVLGDYLDSKILLDKFNKMSEWTKLMILRILKDNSNFDNNLLKELNINNNSNN